MGDKSSTTSSYERDPYPSNIITIMSDDDDDQYPNELEEEDHHPEDGDGDADGDADASDDASGAEDFEDEATTAKSKKSKAMDFGEMNGVNNMLVIKKLLLRKHEF